MKQKQKNRRHFNGEMEQNFSLMLQDGRYVKVEYKWQGKSYNFVAAKELSVDKLQKLEKLPYRLTTGLAEKISNSLNIEIAQ